MASTISMRYKALKASVAGKVFLEIRKLPVLQQDKWVRDFLEACGLALLVGEEDPLLIHRARHFVSILKHLISIDDISIRYKPKKSEILFKIGSFEGGFILPYTESSLPTGFWLSGWALDETECQPPESSISKATLEILQNLEASLPRVPTNSVNTPTVFEEVADQELSTDSPQNFDAPHHIDSLTTSQQEHPVENASTANSESSHERSLEKVSSSDFPLSEPSSPTVSSVEPLSAKPSPLEITSSAPSSSELDASTVEPCSETSSEFGTSDDNKSAHQSRKHSTEPQLPFAGPTYWKSPDPLELPMPSFLNKNKDSKSKTPAVDKMVEIKLLRKWNAKDWEANRQAAIAIAFAKQDLEHATKTGASSLDWRAVKVESISSSYSESGGDSSNWRQITRYRSPVSSPGSGVNSSNWRRK